MEIIYKRVTYQVYWLGQLVWQNKPLIGAWLLPCLSLCWSGTPRPGNKRKTRTRHLLSSCTQEAWINIHRFCLSNVYVAVPPRWFGILLRQSASRVQPTAVKQSLYGSWGELMQSWCVWPGSEWPWSPAHAKKGGKDKSQLTLKWSKINTGGSLHSILS